MSSSPLTPAVVLVRPQEEGNIGSAARAMANMGLDELVLVAPVTRPGRVARAFAVSAGEILDRARIVASLDEALEPYTRIVGTTSARARELQTPLLRPSELATELGDEATEATTAIVFGPESSGLNNEELARCSHWVRIPCAARQPTLNLAQAVLIVAYELYLRRVGPNSQDVERTVPATSGEIEGLFSQLVPLLTKIGFARDDTFSSVLRDLRRLAANARPTSREVTLLRGICRRALNAFGRDTDATAGDISSD
jgi:tRNA (cytidine32/uridine32-2'-O)-methyltransferase